MIKPKILKQPQLPRIFFFQPIRSPFMLKKFGTLVSVIYTNWPSIASIAKKKERIEETIQRYRNFVADFKDSPYAASLKSLLKPLEKEYEL